MLVTPSKISTLSSAEHLTNAFSPMLVTLLGIVTFVSDEQRPNAPLPILVTPSKISTLSSAEH